MNVVAHDDWVSRCNPLTKLTLIPCFGIATIAFPNFGLGITLLGIILVLGTVAHIVIRMLRMMVAFGVPISIMLFVIQGLYSPENKTYIVNLGFAKIGLEGIYYGLKILITLLVFLGTFYLFSKTIYLGRLSATMIEHGVSTRLIYLLLASLNIVPEMQRQVKIVKRAQEARGLRTEGIVLARLKAFIPVIGPVVLSSLINAQTRGMALELKGIDIKNIKTTSLIESDDRQSDRLIRCGLWMFMIGVIIVSVLLRMNDWM